MIARGRAIRLRHVLDGSRRVPYLVGLALQVGCVRGPAPIAPEVLPPLAAESLRTWLAAYEPAAPQQYDLRWLYATQQGQSRGRAAIRYVPPDSVRFDYRAPFGRSGAAAVVADSVLWVRPEEEIGALVEMTPLFWALLGIPRHAPPGYVVSGRQAPGLRLWRFASAVDTMTFALYLDRGPLLQGEIRRDGRAVGTVETRFDPETGQPTEGTMRFPHRAALFSITVNGISPMSEVDASIWKEP